MINFSKLVLDPCMATFGCPVTILPLVSQPVGGVPYVTRGIWNIKSTDILTEDGGTFSNRTITLGIRLADIKVSPKEGDWVSSDVAYLPLQYWQGELIPGSVIDFVIDNSSPDGQGGTVLTLKRQNS